MRQKVRRVPGDIRVLREKLVRLARKVQWVQPDRKVSRENRVSPGQRAYLVKRVR